MLNGLRTGKQMFHIFKIFHGNRVAGALLWLDALSICFWSTAVVQALYEPTSGSTVILLSAKEFQQKVVNAPEGDLWIVEFFANWCGHCQNFAPAYEKAAKALKGYVKVGAIEDQSIMSQYGISGFPTIKAFIGSGKGNPRIESFNGNRDSNSVADFAIGQMSKIIKSRISGKSTSSSSSKKTTGVSDVIVLKDTNFNDILMKDEKFVWFVKFYAPWCGHCKALAPDWESAATKLKGKVKVAKVDATTETVLASRFAIQGFPTLKIFPAGPKSDNLAETYNGSRNVDELVNYALKFFKSFASVEQLISEEQFREVCKTGVCIVSFLPHILDSKAVGRKKELETINHVVKGSVTMPVNFFWSQGGDQYEMENTLNLAFGYPAVVAINLEKNKFAVHKGVFTMDSIKSFLSGLMAGKILIENMRNLPKIVTVKKWDGKDESVQSEHTEEL